MAHGRLAADALTLSAMAGSRRLTFTARTRYVQALNEKLQTTDQERVVVLIGLLGRRVPVTVACQSVEAAG